MAENDIEGLTIVSHPLVQHKLTILRDRDSSTKLFRAVVRETATLLCYEVTRDLPTDLVNVETPIAVTQAPVIAGKKLVIAPILRAGLAMAEGMLDLVPSARVAHIGLYREPISLQAVEYYFKTPEDVAQRLVIIVDPMLATGHTAIAAIDRLKEAGVQEMRFVCLLASRQGAEEVRAAHPDVPIWAAAMDEELNDHGYIVPGLGDAGDRTYGTR
jgi:uracil phosphoribosyltransferase